MSSIYDIEVTRIDGVPYALDAYRGQVLLCVNVASACGYTSQYEGLERLHQAYSSRGFSVLGFPCNQFGRQEPGTHEDIQRFCDVHYGVTFPMHSKIDVNGEQAHPLFRHLTRRARGVLGTIPIKWNFTKFLVDRQGRVVQRFATITKPEALSREIDALLGPIP